MSIDHVHLRRLDLNLLLAFDALVEARSVTAAAERLGLSQSAMSHALARLRALLGDDLLIRERGGLVPTETAEALAGPVRDALASLAAGLDRARGFDPARAERVFRLAMPDYIAAALGPRLVHSVLGDRPGLKLRFEAYGRAAAFAALAAGELDVYLGVADPPDWCASAAAYSDSFRVLYDPTVRPAPDDLATFAAAPHALVAQADSFEGWVDEALGARGLARRVAVSAAGFTEAAGCVVGTDFVLTAPSRAVARLAQNLGLATTAPPVPAPRFRARLLRHRRSVGGPASDWLWARLQDALAELA